MQPVATLLDLNGKIAVVTGAGKGIGQAIAERLAEAGAYVVVTDVDNEACQSTVGSIHEHGWKAEAMRLDVTDQSNVFDVIRSVNDSHGSIDIVVNDAGIYPSKPISEMTTEQLRAVLDVNLIGAFQVLKESAAVMRASGKGGKIINVTSIDALHPSMVGLAHYDASKHGLWGLTKNAALEYAQDNIQINAVAPGGVLTPGVAAMQGEPSESSADDSAAFLKSIPLGRMGNPDEIATVVLFLASPMSSYMVGSQIVVDGGRLLR